MQKINGQKKRRPGKGKAKVVEFVRWFFEERIFSVRQDSCPCTGRGLLARNGDKLGPNL